MIMVVHRQLHQRVAVAEARHTPFLIHNDIHRRIIIPLHICLLEMGAIIHRNTAVRHRITGMEGHGDLHLLAIHHGKCHPSEVLLPGGMVVDIVDLL